jgi:hypothetical protein
MAFYPINDYPWLQLPGSDRGLPPGLAQIVEEQMPPAGTSTVDKITAWAKKYGDLLKLGAVLFLVVRKK